METTAILNVGNGPAAAHRCCRRGLPGLILLCTVSLVFLTEARGDAALSAFDDLADAEKYRQLNLIWMVSEGIDAAFLQALLPERSGTERAPPEPLPRLDVDDFQTPLNRIVDQHAMIARAAHVFRFALENSADITRALNEIAASDPIQVAQVDLIQLAEDAIIIRSALAGSMEYLSKNGEPALAADLETYQNRTVYLRNTMEYWKFDKELGAITDNAMADTGGRMEAYQRMLEDEPNMLGFKEHLQAVEEIYRNTRPLKVNPKDLESEELIDKESQVH